MQLPDGRRREPRYLVRVPILLTAAQRSIAVVTEDVSRGGVFLRTDLPLSLRQLVHLELVLPPRAVRFYATGTLLHAIPRSEEREAGIGVEFFGIGDEALAAWGRFIEHAQEHFPEAGERARVLPRGEAFVPAYRRSEHIAVLRVEPETLGDLRTLHARDVSRGGMFLLTDEPFALGDVIGLQLVHPHTQDVFETACVVRRTVREHGVAGIGVEFLDPEEARERCYDFIFDGIADLFDEESIR